MKSIQHSIKRLLTVEFPIAREVRMFIQQFMVTRYPYVDGAMWMAWELMDEVEASWTR